MMCDVDGTQEGHVTQHSIVIGGRAAHGQFLVPALIAGAGEHASRRFIEFFTANIRNRNTRLAYAKAVGDFAAWCERLGLSLTAVQARELLDSIDISTLIGLRDRALIGTMAYSFARVSAVVNMDVEDYWQNGKRWWLRLHEKGGKHHEVPAHHNAEAYLDAYVEAAGIAGEGKTPLFRSAIGRTEKLGTSRLTRQDALRMIKRRAAKLGLPARTCCHTFRATGITAYLQNGGTIEKAQQIASHESPRTTKLYDRTSEDITLDEIERILI